MRDPLGREGLDVLDGVAGGELEKGADEVEALVIGEVGGRLLVEWRAVEVLRASVWTQCWSPEVGIGGLDSYM